MIPSQSEILLMDHILVIMGYGFSFPENASDHYSLGFSPAIAAYIKATKIRRSASQPTSDASDNQSLMDSDNIQSNPAIETVKSGNQVLESSEDLNVEEILEQNIHWVRLLDDNKYEFSPNFLEYFSIAVENPREARVADSRSAPKTYFSHGDFWRNQLHVLCAVIMILQKGQRAIRKYDKDLPEAPQNSKQVDAARYRDSQLKILDGVLSSMCSLLKSIGTANPLEPHSRLVRLEHTFTKLPADLLKDFRAVLNAGIGTRNPMKIRERGGVDFAFTAWLCGLWLYSKSNSTGEDELNPTPLRWLRFLQQNYPEPSVEPIEHQENENPVLEERAEWFDPVRGTSGKDDQDCAFIAESYFEAVQAATGKHSQSVYNDERVTVRRLAWCYNIIKNEGVWWPNLDQEGDDEADDWVLFLDLGNS